MDCDGACSEFVGVRILDVEIGWHGVQILAEWL